MSETVNGTAPISEPLRGRLRNIIGADMRQMLADYDVDPGLLDHDVDHAGAMNALIDHVVQSVRIFDGKEPKA